MKKMQWTYCNTTLEDEALTETPIWHDFTFHRFGLILSALFGIIAILISLYLVFMHATHYLKPWEQRHIIRVLFMVPIYSFVSFLSFYYYRHAVYFEVIRDCYEAFAIASFFALLCHYVAPDLHNQKDYFRSLQPNPWILPVSWFRKCCGGERGPWRTPRSGLTWFNIIWLGVFQYCFVRVFMTFVALITEVAGRYCLDSLSPAFAHVWVMAIEGVCVTIAMFCLLQFFFQLRGDLVEQRPGLKIVAIKLVIFLSFWQNIIISFLTSSGAIKPTKHIQSPDIRVGIPSLLLCIEMAIFSILHLFAFPWKVYDVKRSPIVAAESGPGYLPDPRTAYKGGFMGIHALLDAFNPWDLVKAIGRGFRWAVVGRRNREQDISYKNSAQGTGLEPTHPGAGGLRTSFHNIKPGRYQALDDNDDDRLLHNAQSNPTGPPNLYPNHSAGDISSTSNIYDEDPDHLRTMHPTPGTLRRSGEEQETGVVDGHLEEDTGYHGAQPSPLPPGLMSGQHQHQQPPGAPNPWGEPQPTYPPRGGNVF